MIKQREKFFDKINNDLLAMSKVAFKQIEFISQQINRVDISDKEEELMHNELILDSLEVKLKKNIINAIMLYSPRASDLRKIISCYDIAIYLERSGDLALNIYEYLKKVNLNGNIFNNVHTKLRKFLEIAETMIKNAIYSFSCEDILLIKETLYLEELADNFYEEIGKDLVVLTENKTLSQENIVDLLSINSLSYNIERIADNATNIVEAAVYLVEGRNIQHNNYSNNTNNNNE